MCFLWVGFACPHRPFGRSLGRYVIVGTNVGMLALAAVRIEREAAMECLCSFVWEDVARTQSPSRSLQLAKTVLVLGAATVSAHKVATLAKSTL